jgi:hypothetical protein
MNPVQMIGAGEVTDDKSQVGVCQSKTSRGRGRESSLEGEHQKDIGEEEPMWLKRPISLNG